MYWDSTKKLYNVITMSNNSTDMFFDANFYLDPHA